MKNLNLNNLIDIASFSPRSSQSPNAWMGHIPFAAWLMPALEPKVFVELGTHSGNSYFAFCQSVNEANAATKCYAVDTWQGDEHAGSYGDDVFDQVRAHNQTHYAGFSSLLRMKFDDAVDYFADNTIDLLHIDGLHTYEAVKHDFETWLPKLSPGAVVLFHDTNVREKGFGVWKLWKELQARYPDNLEFFHSHGLGVLQLDGATGEKKLAWLDPDSADRQQLKGYFSALGARQLERFELAQTNTHIADLNQALAERDGEIAILHQAVARRDGQIDDLYHDVAERDGQIADFYHERAERDSLITDLKQAAAERGGQIAGFKQAMAERDGQIAGLNQAMAERDEQIAGLNQALAERDAQINAIKGSLTWRLTSPLRHVLSKSPLFRRFLRGTMKLIWWTCTFQLIRRLQERRALRRALPTATPHFAPPADDYSVAVPFSYGLAKWDAEPSLAVICHMYYAEMADEFKRYFSNIPFHFDLFITTDTREKKLRISQSFSGWEKGKIDIRLAQNRGRDIAPKLITCRDVYDHYEFILHVHTKKSLNWGDLHGWRTFLLETLLGSTSIVESVFEAFRLDPNLGMIAPQHIEMIRQYLGKEANVENADRFARRLGLSISPDRSIDFPSGSMFWARSAALQPLLDLKLSFKDFPKETGQVDGTLGHLIERMYFLICEKAGFCWMKISLASWHIDFNRFKLEANRLAVNRDGTIDFDEEFYLQANPEVAHAVALGTISSGYAHYCTFGQYEGRVWRDRQHKLGFSQSSDKIVLVKSQKELQELMGKLKEPHMDSHVGDKRSLACVKPISDKIDDQLNRKEAFYRLAYEKSAYREALDFALFSLQVNRLADRKGSMIDFDESFYLHANPDVAEAVTLGSVPCGYIHYCLFGQFEERVWRDLQNRQGAAESSDSMANTVNPEGEQALISQPVGPFSRKETFYREAYEKSPCRDSLDFIRFTQEVDRLADHQDSLIDFDEDFYLKANPDVAQTVTDGAVPNGYIHYCLFGQFEGRPCDEQELKSFQLSQKESFYRRAYEKSAYRETLDFACFTQELDRLADHQESLIDFDEGFYLKVNPDVAQLVTGGVIPNGYIHYCLFGQFEGRPCNEQEFKIYQLNQKESYYRRAYEKSACRETLDFTRFTLEVDRLADQQDSLIDFDECFYLQANPDVAKLVTQGSMPCGYIHYCLCGQFEGRVWSDHQIKQVFSQTPRLSQGFTRPANLLPAPIYKPDLTALPKSTEPFLLIFFSHLQEDLFFAGYTEFFKDFKPIIDSFNRVVLSVECPDFNPALAARYSDRIKVIHESRLSDLECRPSLIVSFNSELFLKARDMFQDLDRTIYYCQDYEPGFTSFGTGYIRSEMAIAHSRNIILSTTLLYQFLKNKGLLTDSQRILITAPQIEPVEVDPEKTRRLFFYFRPESFQSRNLPELLMEAAEQFCAKYTGYEIYMMGTIDTCYSYRKNGNSIFVNAKLAKADYIKLLSSCDVVVSMIYSAHPGVIAFQAAASGIPTVTNIFENRDAALLQSISDNIVPYDPVRESLLERIETALSMPKGRRSFNKNLYGPDGCATLSDFVNAIG